MKLYASPLACSGAVQMILTELEIPVEIEYVDIYSQPHVVLRDRSEYSKINPKGAVPALELDSGEILTEVGVILQYVADLKPETGLFARPGDMRRIRILEWLSYIGSDVHKSIGPLFNPRLSIESKNILRQNLVRRLTYLENTLATKEYLMGDSFTIADAYFFIMMGWEPYTKFDFSAFTNLTRYHARIKQRPSFQKFLEHVAPFIERMPLPDFKAAKDFK